MAAAPKASSGSKKPAKKTFYTEHAHLFNKVKNKSALECSVCALWSLAGTLAVRSRLRSSPAPCLHSQEPKDFGVGRDIQPKKDLSRFVKWPRYVRIQRQRAILKKRLKVPPAVAQFQAALEKNAGAFLPPWQQ